MALTRALIEAADWLFPRGSDTTLYVTLLFPSLFLAVFSLLFLTIRKEEQRRQSSRSALRLAEQAFESAVGNRQSLGASNVVGSGDSAVIGQPASAYVPGGDKGFTLGTGTPHTLAELWKVTHARLGVYHDDAQAQSRRSFRNAQGAMILGFVLLATCVVVAVQQQLAGASAITVGLLGAVGAALAGYVSHTFMKSQQHAAAHLRSYFDQPVNLSRLLVAERLITESDLPTDAQQRLLEQLTQTMVMGTSAPKAGNAK